MGGLPPLFYLDAAPVIYVVEKVEPFATRLELRLNMPGLILVASELTRLECRVKPIRLADAGMPAEYDNYFAHSVKDYVPLSRPVMERATDIRA
jgi:uncharacterized protein